MAIIGVEQAEVQEELPIIETESDSFIVLIKLIPMVADGAVSKAEMVMSEGVAGIVLDNLAMAPDGVGIIFHSEIIIGERITDSLIAVRRIAGMCQRRPLAARSYKDNQKQSQPAISKQRPVFPRTYGKYVAKRDFTAIKLIGTGDNSVEKKGARRICVARPHGQRFKTPVNRELAAYRYPRRLALNALSQFEPERVWIMKRSERPSAKLRARPSCGDGGRACGGAWSPQATLRPMA